MGGTRVGGLRAAETNKTKYGEDFYKNIGHIGGKNGNTGGFAANHDVARKAGSIGGKRSKKGYKYIETSYGYHHYLNKKTNTVERFKVDA